MKFIDEAVITVQSGDGGKGCVSFRRERSVPRGGPDGGDGGCGGDVIFSSTSGHHSLYQFRFKRHFKAKNGAHGQGKQKTGRNGGDLIIEIPPGTLVRDAVTGNVLKDFTKPGETVIAAKGGIGGRGNSRFQTSTHRAPRFAQPGEPGQTVSLELELKLIADVGIIGLPNAGKSTLIRAISSAHPKVGNYPFTTLTPNLGVVRVDSGEPYIVADIPGLIEGAHIGAGLGIRFLRHIERTRMLIHLVDGSSIEPENPLKAFNTVNQELFRYNEALAKKQQIIAVNKLDLPEAELAAGQFKTAAKAEKVHYISALTGKGIQALLSETQKMLEKIRE